MEHLSICTNELCVRPDRDDAKRAVSLSDGLASALALLEVRPASLRQHASELDGHAEPRGQ